MARKSKDTHSLKTGVELTNEEFVNIKTGEVVSASTFIMRNVDFNFDKIWLFHLAEAYDLIGGKSVEILNFLMENRNSENLTICTQRGISKSLEVSLDTVTRVMTKLKEKNVISMPQQGVYRINPDIIFKGSNDKRMRILLEYRKEKETENIAENHSLREEAEILSEMKNLKEHMENLSKRLSEVRKKKIASDEAQTPEAAAE